MAVFSIGASEASNSLVGNAKPISKVYFPRLIIPAGAVNVQHGRFSHFLQFAYSFDDLVMLHPGLRHSYIVGAYAYRFFWRRWARPLLSRR